jgi:hypothetical protein
LKAGVKKVVFSISNIKREQIRGKIEIGDFVSVTPKLKAYSINKSRSSAVSTFTASFQINPEELAELEDLMNQNIGSAIGGSGSSGTSLGPVKVFVAAVVGTTSIPASFLQLFSGFLRQVSIKRSFHIPGAFILDVSGSDIMYLLENRTYSRRVKLDGLGVFSVITGVIRKGAGESIGRRSTSGAGIGRAGGRGTSSPGEIETLAVFPAMPINKDVKHNTVGQKALRGTSSSGGLGSQSSATGNDQLLIVPRTRILGVGQEETFRCENCGEALDDSTPEEERFIWEIQNPEVGKWVVGGSLVTGAEINDLNPGDTDTPVVYRQVAFGDNTITLTSPTGLFGTADVLGLPIHDHTSLGQGGPAFGVYATISST